MKKSKHQRGIFNPCQSKKKLAMIRGMIRGTRTLIVKISMMSPELPEELPVNEEAVQLANRYIESKIIPANERNDALHIAVATIHNLDVIVSWNFEHMVKLKTRREVPAINTLMKYRGIEICSPLEIIEP